MITFTGLLGNWILDLFLKEKKLLWATVGAFFKKHNTSRYYCAAQLSVFPQLDVPHCNYFSLHW